MFENTLKVDPWPRESVDTCNHSMNTELEELAQHAVEIEEESKQMTIGETFNQKLADFTSKLQNALLTPEMADAFETIKFVFGKYNSNSVYNNYYRLL